ncbi:hypothetical protein BKA64DRAFT_444688 [Cadophora sp. MPI-SDFR-AT-0126]|nr:hypothetical protein BKA64DRAFT_444688 [Leotiomycetes sp. MPI-SDFR-AT-0126]
MDALPAFVLAGFIVRFVASARDVLSPKPEGIKPLNASNCGTTELETIINEISAIQGSNQLANLSSFDAGNRPKPQHEVLAKLCEKSYSLHNEVRAFLERFQLDGGNMEHEGLHATRKFDGNYGENHELHKRLQELEWQIDEHLPSYILSQRNATVKWVQELAETSRRLNINRSRELQRLITDTDIAFQTLSIQSPGVEHGRASPSRGRIGSSSTVSQGKSASNIILAFSSIAQQGRTYTTECDIIRSLTFNEQKYYLSGKDKHSSPHDQVCAPSTNCPVPDHLDHWFEKGGGLFWISGGPGCGKSEFMAHLSSCSIMKDGLLQWAGTSPVVYTFCSCQKPQTKTRYSISDLLSTISCQVLKRHPELIAPVFRDKWAYLMGIWGETPAEVKFSREDLTDAIESFALLMSSNARFCFLIDGLDQFEDFGTEIVILLQHLSKSPSVKIYVTSQLDSTALDEMGLDPTQRLHLPDFTRPIIDQHIIKRLNETPWIAQRKTSDAYLFDQVFEYLRQKSKGSFTWVSLVLSVALSDMKILDDMGDLLARLEQLPTHLSELFLHVLDDVEHDLHDKQARILLIASQAQDPLDVLAFSFLDEVDSNFTSSRAAVPMGQQEAKSRSQSVRVQILGLCGRLLDVLPASEKSSKELVIFPHSSFREYLRGIEAREILIQRLKSPFDPQRSLCDILLAQIKFHQLGPFWEQGGPIHGLVLHFLEEVGICKLVSNEVLGTHVNEVEEVVCQRKGRTFWWWQKRSVEKGERTSTFLELIIQCRLVGYLNWRFEHCPNLVPEPLEMANLLESTLIPPAGTTVNSDLVKVFLDHGADPNHASDHGYHLDAKPTPWRLLLLHLVATVQNETLSTTETGEEWFLVLLHLINAGADLETPVYPNASKSPNNSTSGLSVDEIVRMTTTQENASFLCRQIDERKNRRLAKSGWLGWQ